MFESEKKTDVVKYLEGIQPRRLTPQRAFRHSRVALYLVIRRLWGVGLTILIPLANVSIVELGTSKTRHYGFGSYMGTLRLSKLATCLFGKIGLCASYDSRPVLSLRMLEIGIKAFWP